jgi:hypothetical protein
VPPFLQENRIWKLLLSAMDSPIAVSHAISDTDLLNIYIYNKYLFEYLQTNSSFETDNEHVDSDQLGSQPFVI